MPRAASDSMEGASELIQEFEMASADKRNIIRVRKAVNGGKGSSSRKTIDSGKGGRGQKSRHVEDHVAGGKDEGAAGDEFGRAMTKMAEGITKLIQSKTKKDDEATGSWEDDGTLPGSRALLKGDKRL